MVALFVVSALGVFLFVVRIDAMSLLRHTGGIAVIAALCGVSALAAENWTRFRGPNGSGVSNATNLPVQFGPETNVRWKAPLPPGHSSPVFTDTHIFITAHSPDRDAHKLFVIGLERKTGKQLWQREVPRQNPGRLEQVNGPASPSPVTDGQDVYAFFQEYGLVSYTAEGKERWRLPLGPFNMFYGFGASPILVDGTLMLAVDQDNDAYLMAVDSKTGKPRWRVSRPHVISGYSTPTVYRPKSGGAELLIPESFQLTSYSVATGGKLWWVRGLACEMKSVASIDDDTLYVNGWGFSQNQPGTQIPTVDFAAGLKLYDKNSDGFVGRSEIAGDDRDVAHAQARGWLRRLRRQPRSEARRQGVGRLSLDARRRERPARDSTRRPW